MKKKGLIAVLALIAVIALSTCDGGFGDNELKVEHTDVLYNLLPDGRTQITLLLDGVTVPVTQAQRALHRDLAKMSHDYFEAVFVSGPIIARAAWEIGQTAGIRGVDRGASSTGINYGAVSGSPAAVIFVGRKDGTLQGIGQLTHSSPNAGMDISAAANTPVIDETTRSVVFTVTPLYTTLTGDAVYDYSNANANSSFLTAANATTAPSADGATHTFPSPITSAGTQSSWNNLEGTPYPMYSLPKGGSAGSTAKTVEAAYQIGRYTYVGTPPLTPPYDVEEDLSAAPHAASIMVLPGGAAGLRVPRFQAGGQLWDVMDEYYYDGNVTLTNNLGGNLNPTPPTPVTTQTFVNPITFTFSLPTNKEGIFALVFQIPVYAITHLPSTNGANGFRTWYIRPGFGPNQYNIDSGSNAGGAVLLGVGVTGVDWIYIYTTGIGLGD